MIKTLDKLNRLVYTTRRTLKLTQTKNCYALKIKTLEIA